MSPKKTLKNRCPERAFQSQQCTLLSRVKITVKDFKTLELIDSLSEQNSQGGKAKGGECSLKEIPIAP